MLLKSYKDTLDEVIRPNKELVKNPYTVSHALKKIIKTYYRPCQVGLIHEVEHAIGLPMSKLPCHVCPNYDKQKHKCRGWE